MDNTPENKFNFSEEEEKETNNVEQSKEAVVQDAKGLVESLKGFFFEVFSFKHDTDKDATIEAIKNDIPFKGATAWILICSIFVASIGLNYNSTAVVIGAMLISPLMGPILGIGFSIAVNDIDILKKSLINFGVMVVLSILTAYLFFEIFPLRQDSSELIARTRPDIRDVLIAFFGGLALIIARTKKGTIASVIFGVAIATALMPPLCTVGYGLAKGWEPGITEGTTGYSYAIGALYLFTINTIFIALATFLVLKLLRFPMMKYVNSKKRRFIGRLAALLAIIVMVPAVWTFISVLRETGYQNNYKSFIKKNIASNDNLWLRKDTIDMNNKIIKLSFNGEVDNAIKTAIENDLRNKFVYPNISDFTLEWGGLVETRSYDMMLDQLNRLYERLDDKVDIISDLERQIDSLQTELTKRVNKLDRTQFLSLAKDARIEFDDLEYFSFSRALESKDFKNVDTLNLALIQWKSNLTDSLKIEKEQQLLQWLKNQLNIEDVLIQNQ
ncbi:MAG: DUF389 domain-containing protein [Winogradskyella sp.]|nr:DUF389 domain-containing protein [Winogradskyella sp.]